MAASFTGSLSDPKTPFPHFWEHTVGSGHATLALRADWQQQLARARQEIGCRYVRFHGILSDDMGTLIEQNNHPLYSFHNTDQIFDFLLSIGMKPFVELSFMPWMLASNDEIVFHYRGRVCPPNSQEKWNALITKIVQHWVDRYGIDEVKQWFFEVWNEPNLRAFWTGTQTEYFNFYACTAKAIKAVNAALQVGGPATASNAWIPEFRAFCGASDVPLDFISTHHYPTDAFGMPGDDTETQLSLSRRSVLREQTQQAKKEAGDLPLYYTEWSTSSNPRDALHDESYAAAYIAKNVLEQQGIVNSYSYWTFSDIFEENYFPSVPFHGGFGLLNIHNIAKPSYRAYQLLHMLGTERVALMGSHATVDAWCTAGNGKVEVLLVNSALPRHDISEEAVTVSLAAAAYKTARIAIVDGKRSNAKAKWLEIGAPEYPSKAEVAMLDAVSQLVWEAVPLKPEPAGLSFTVTLPPQSVALVILE